MSLSGERVIVVGGGIVGLATARRLAQHGAAVTLLERGELGRGASAGNAGWVVPSIALPVPAPGLRSKGLRWFLQPDSPLYLRPQAVPRLLPWLWQFWKRCTPAAFERGARALMPFASDAVELYQGWSRELGEGAVDWRQKGLLMAFRTPEALAEELELLERFGYGPIRILDAGALEGLEPALASRGGAWAGGLHVLPEGHVDPVTVTSALAASCRALGVTVRDRCLVSKVLLSGGQARGVAVHSKGQSGSSEEVTGDHVVIATGAEAGPLAAQCGTRIPMQAAKGYSVTVRRPQAEILHPVYLAEAKVALTPFAETLRIAGMLELSGVNNRLDPRRLAGFERAAEREVPGITQGGERREWVGMRPLTPDGLPVIGALPRVPNVWMNTGHQMLGITLAPASARLLVERMAGAAPAAGEVAGAFSPARFATR